MCESEVPQTQEAWELSITIPPVVSILITQPIYQTQNLIWLRNLAG